MDPNAENGKEDAVQTKGLFKQTEQAYTGSTAAI